MKNNFPSSSEWVWNARKKESMKIILRKRSSHFWLENSNCVWGSLCVLTHRASSHSQSTKIRQTQARRAQTDETNFSPVELTKYRHWNLRIDEIVYTHLPFAFTHLLKCLLVNGFVTLQGSYDIFCSINDSRFDSETMTKLLDALFERWLKLLVRSHITVLGCRLWFFIAIEQS